MRHFLLLALVVYSCALTIKVEPRAEECFYEDAVKGATMTLQFQVIAGGLLDIDARIFDVDGVTIREWSVVSDGKHQWTVHGEGKYRFCFSNHMARWTPKWVSFFVNQGLNADLARIEHIDPIERTIMELSEGLAELQDEQKYLRSVERVHRETIDTTNVRMLYWSVFEVFVLVTMGFFQIVYMKRFLEVKNSV